jgi:hypothetical protein
MHRCLVLVLLLLPSVAVAHEEPPQALWARATDAGGVRIRFDEPVDATAEVTTNYRYLTCVDEGGGCNCFLVGTAESIVRIAPDEIEARFPVDAAGYPCPSLGCENPDVVVSGVQDLAGLVMLPVQVDVDPCNPPDRHPYLMLHLEARATKGDPCAAAAPARTLDCAAMVVGGNAESPYDLYLVAVDEAGTAGFSGVELGITYSADLRVFSWTDCSDLGLSSPGWPATGSGLVASWEPCRRVGDENVVVGSLYVYSYVYAYAANGFSMVAHPESGFLGIAECSGEEIPVLPDDVAVAGFGSAGINPCDPVPVVPVTWGGLKRLFGEER